MFDITTGVRQGSILFLMMDFIMRKSMSNLHYGISWSPGRLIDLDFTDDIVMLSDSHDIIQHMTDDLNTNAAKVGLRISCEKSKVKR